MTDREPGFSGGADEAPGFSEDGDAALSELPREIAPRRDLWPGIRAEMDHRGAREGREELGEGVAARRGPSRQGGGGRSTHFRSGLRAAITLAAAAVAFIWFGGRAPVQEFPGLSVPGAQQSGPVFTAALLGADDRAIDEARVVLASDPRGALATLPLAALDALVAEAEALLLGSPRNTRYAQRLVELRHQRERVVHQALRTLLAPND